MAFYRTGGGGSSTLKRLCYIEFEQATAVRIPSILNATYDTDYSEYLSYDASTKKFTVLKAFDALLVSWVYTYRTAGSSKSQGSFYINDVQQLYHSSNQKTVGEIAGSAMARKMNIGDTFYSYTPSTNGYPQQMLKVYIGNSDLTNVCEYNGTY